VLFALGVVLSKKHEQVALFFFLTGLSLAVFMLSRNMVLPAAVQALASAMGAIALLGFGGEIIES
jgi:NADH:ubiquinone oxidoreductase subunit 6 (subunit J)